MVPVTQIGSNSDLRIPRGFDGHEYQLVRRRRGHGCRRRHRERGMNSVISRSRSFCRGADKSRHTHLGPVERWTKRLAFFVEYGTPDVIPRHRVFLRCDLGMGHTTGSKIGHSHLFGRLCGKAGARSGRQARKALKGARRFHLHRVVASSLGQFLTVIPIAQ